jgi:hypothetical protein
MSIPHGFDEAFERVNQLAAIFNQNEQGYQSVGYSEAPVAEGGGK